MAAPFDNDAIGNRIREARKDHGWTQTELGEAIGVTQGMINKLETGESSLTLENLFKIAKALDYPVVHFIDVKVGELSADEVELIETYRSLGEGLPRRWAIIMLREWAKEMKTGWPEFRKRHGF